MGSCAAMNDPPFICPLTLQLLWFIPVLYTSSLATNGASRSWARFWLFIGVWVFWCLLEQNDSSAFWERLPEMSYTTSVVCSCCSDAPKLQGQKLRRALGGGSNTTGGSPSLPAFPPTPAFDGPIIFYNWAKGPISWGGISTAIQSLPAA